MIPAKIKQAILVLLTVLSGTLFVISICKNRWLFSILGMPFFMVAVSAIHELGHVAGCAINKNQVTGLRTALFTVQKGHLSINDRPYFEGYCSFLRSTNDEVVYLCGPLASLVCFSACLVWWLLAKQSSTAILCVVVTGVHVLKNSIPHGHNDLRLFIKEVKKGDSKA